MNRDLVGRRAECERLDTLAREVAAGRGGAIVLRGDPGVGKTALLEYLSGRVEGWQVVRCVGVEWEMELAYSSLHQLCLQMLDQLDKLPGPQRGALARVFGQHDGPAPDPFMVALATLSLLAEEAESEPLQIGRASCRERV